MYYSLLLSAVSVADRDLPPSLLEKEEDKAMADPDRAEEMLFPKCSARLCQPLLRPQSIFPPRCSSDCTASIQQFLSNTYYKQDIALGTRGAMWNKAARHSHLGGHVVGEAAG